MDLFLTYEIDIVPALFVSNLKLVSIMLSSLFTPPHFKLNGIFYAVYYFVLSHRRRQTDVLSYNSGWSFLFIRLLVAKPV
jgi:hypothetical protein